MSIPLTYDDARFAGNTTSTNVVMSSGTLLEKSITDTGATASIVALNNIVVDTCRVNSREGVRVAGDGVDIRNSYIEANGIDDDHADSIQAYSPGQTGSHIQVTDTAVVMGTVAINSGLFIADNWSGTVTLQNVMFKGGLYGCRIHADSGCTVNVSFTDVFFVGPFTYDSLLIAPNGTGILSVTHWENVRNATIVDGVLVPGSLISEPPSNVPAPEGGFNIDNTRTYPVYVSLHNASTAVAAILNTGPNFEKPASYDSWAEGPHAVVLADGQSAAASSGTATVEGKASGLAEGQSATVSAGTVEVVTDQVTAASVIGQSATGSAGSVSVTAIITVSAAVAGQSATVSAGTVDVTAKQVVSVDVTGQFAIGSAGGVSVSAGGSVSAAVGGVQAAVSAGTVSVTANQAVNVTVTGLSATISAGDVSVIARVTATVLLTGRSATISAGTVTVGAGIAASTSVTGQSATASVGTISVVGKARADVTGLSATASVGTATVGESTSVTVPVIGRQAIASAGILTIVGKARVTIEGLSATASAGIATVIEGFKTSTTVTGTSATGSAGTVAVVSGSGLLIAVSGQFATASAGTVSVSAEVSGVGVWTGSDWTAKAVKYWDGIKWLAKPVKWWNGTAWVWGGGPQPLVSFVPRDGVNLGNVVVDVTTVSDPNLFDILVYRVPKGAALDRTVHVSRIFPALPDSLFTLNYGDPMIVNSLANGDFDNPTSPPTLGPGWSFPTVFVDQSALTAYTPVYESGYASEMGGRFTFAKRGQVTAVRYWFASTSSTVARRIAAWDMNSPTVPIATAMGPVHDGSTGWKTVYFDTPIQVAPGIEYLFSCNIPDGYPRSDGITHPIINGDVTLTATTFSGSGPNSYPGIPIDSLLFTDIVFNVLPGDGQLAHAIQPSGVMDYTFWPPVAAYTGNVWRGYLNVAAATGAGVSLRLTKATPSDMTPTSDEDIIVASSLPGVAVGRRVLIGNNPNPAAGAQPSVHGVLTSVALFKETLAAAPQGEWDLHAIPRNRHGLEGPVIVSPTVLVV